MEHAELESRLASLGQLLKDRLSDEQRQWFTEFLNAGEYGIALEMLADWLCEDDRLVTTAERAEAERLAHAMGNVERVMGPLALCPE